MRNWVIVLVVAVSLGGCMLNREDRMQAHSIACQQYGLTPGSGDFAACMQREEQAWQTRFSNAMDSMQQYSYQQQQLELQRQQMFNQRMNQNRMVNCRTSYWGNTANTTCY